MSCSESLRTLVDEHDEEKDVGCVDRLKETNTLLRVGDAGRVVEVAEILLERRSHGERR